MKQFLMCVLLLSGVAVSHAQPKMSAADVKSSAAAVFHYIVWRCQSNSSPHLQKGENKLFVSAFDARERDITAAVSIKYLRNSGYNAYAGWRADKVAPNGDFRALYVSKPEIKSTDIIRWQIYDWGVVAKGSEFDNSLSGYWVTMKKEKKGWKATRWEHGIAAG